MLKVAILLRRVKRAIFSNISNAQIIACEERRKCHARVCFPFPHKAWTALLLIVPPPFCAQRLFQKVKLNLQRNKMCVSVCPVCVSEGAVDHLKKIKGARESEAKLEEGVVFSEDSDS